MRLQCFSQSVYLRALSVTLYQHTRAMDTHTHTHHILVTSVCMCMCVCVCVCLYLLPGLCRVSVHFEWCAAVHQHPEMTLRVKRHVQGAVRKGQCALGNQRLLLQAEEVQRGQSGHTHKQGEW